MEMNLIVVSILVLMDLPFLQTSSQRMSQIWQRCFNPCSYGSFVLTHKFIFDRLSRNKVSILVLMDLSFLQRMKKAKKRLKNVVSILVLMDLSFLRVEIVEKQNLQIKFQSLFLWIFRSYFQSYDTIVACYQRFNPCSYGSFVLTSWNHKRLHWKSILVSILVLMDLSFLHLNAVTC